MYKFCPYCGGELTQVNADSFTCQRCTKSIYLNSKPTSSVVPVYQDQMLVAVRGVQPQIGKLDTIGGFLNNGEEPLVGAIRELEEETGLKVGVKDLHYIGLTVDSYVYEDSKIHTLNIFYQLDCSEKLTLTPADDVSELRWVPIKGDHDWGFETLRHVSLMVKPRGVE